MSGSQLALLLHELNLERFDYVALEKKYQLPRGLHSSGWVDACSLDRIAYGMIFEEWAFNDAITFSHKFMTEFLTNNEIRDAMYFDFVPFCRELANDGNTGNESSNKLSSCLEAEIINIIDFFSRKLQFSRYDNSSWLNDVDDVFSMVESLYRSNTFAQSISAKIRELGTVRIKSYEFWFLEIQYAARRLNSDFRHNFPPELTEMSLSHLGKIPLNDDEMACLSRLIEKIRS